MTAPTHQELQETKLAVDNMRAVFRSGGKVQPKHQRALDALAKFCRVDAYNHHGADQAEMIRLVGRREVYNFIMFCLDYPKEERRKLVKDIKELEDARDGRRPDTDND